MNSRKENWSNYWKQGLIESCSSTIKSKDSDLAVFWSKLANSIEPGNTVVDLCTGAGAVIKELIQAQEVIVQGEIKFYGVEISSYPNQEKDFSERMGSSNVMLLNNTSIENIPLTDHSVDFLISQFGVEYALGDDFYKEATRLLKKGGKINFAMHHNNSILYRVAKEEVGHYNFVNEEVGLFEALEKLIPYFALLKNPANKSKLDKDPEALRIRDNFNHALSDIKLATSKSTHPDLLHDILNSAATTLNLARNENKKVALEFCKNVKQQLNDSYHRSLELIDAALSEIDVVAIAEKLSEYFTNNYEIEEMFSNNEIVAWGLILERKD